MTEKKAAAQIQEVEVEAGEAVKKDQEVEVEAGEAVGRLWWRHSSARVTVAHHTPNKAKFPKLSMLRKDIGEAQKLVAEMSDTWSTMLKELLELYKASKASITSPPRHEQVESNSREKCDEIGVPKQ